MARSHLGISEDDVVREAYRDLSRKVHPDKGGSSDDQKKLNEAYQSWCDAADSKSVHGGSRKAGATAPKRSGRSFFNEFRCRQKDRSREMFLARAPKN